MSDIRDWDRDANNNQDPVPDGFREGMAPGGVNNSSREVMAAVRRQMEITEWFDWGHAVTYVSPTSFSVPGDVTSIYHVGRRVWAQMPVGGPVYGRVTSSTFVTSTTVEVVWDSGVLLLESGIQMSVAVISTANTSLPMDWIAGQLGLQTPGILAFKDEQEYTTELTDSLVPIGTMRIWPAATPPASPGTWLNCNGAAVSQTTYAVLFALIGHSFGADPGGGDFRLPDLRARVPVGHDPGNATGRMTGYREGFNPDPIGNAGGEENHTQAYDEMHKHSHGHDTQALNYGTRGGSGRGGSPVPGQGGNTSEEGGTSAFNVTQPGQVVNYVIRAL